jgi:hypothetical protein
MTYSIEDEKKIYMLSNMLKKLFHNLNVLGEDIEHYQSLKKIENILKTKDPKGMKKIKQHLMMDVRMIEDNQLEGDSLDKGLDEIYNYVNSNNIFTS